MFLVREPLDQPEQAPIGHEFIQPDGFLAQENGLAAGDQL
jgi:hypothetical protein